MNTESIGRIDGAFGELTEPRLTASMDMRHQHKLGNGCYLFIPSEAQEGDEFIPYEGVHHWA